MSDSDSPAAPPDPLDEVLRDAMQVVYDASPEGTAFALASQAWPDAIREFVKLILTTERQSHATREAQLQQQIAALQTERARILAVIQEHRSYLHDQGRCDHAFDKLVADLSITDRSRTMEAVIIPAKTVVTINGIPVRLAVDTVVETAFKNMALLTGYHYASLPSAPDASPANE